VQRLPQVEALIGAVKDCETVGGTWDDAVSGGFLFHGPALAVPASTIVAGDFNLTFSTLGCAPNRAGIDRTTPAFDRWLVFAELVREYSLDRELPARSCFRAFICA
jgi:hypothetical protein